MDEATRQRLDRAFAERQQRQEAEKQRSEQSKSEHQRFLEEFERVKREVIRPVFEQYGEYMKGQGFSYKIDEAADAGSSDPAIQLRLALPGEEVDDSYSYLGLGFSLVTYARIVFVNSGGARGISIEPARLDIQQVTRQLVSAKTQEVIERILQKF